VAKLPITIACGPYDRVRALREKRVTIDGCEANFLTGGPEELFFRAIKHQEFDVCELSMSSCMMALSRGQAHYLPIPVFLSRVFRHSAFYVRTDRGIREPKDLIGREVGVPEYQMTAALWARGILEDEYGIPPSAIKWRTGGLHQAGRSEKIKLKLAADIEVKPIQTDKSLDGMLRDGELDAVVSARPPLSHDKRLPNIGRLFPNYKKVERDYFAKTGLFPIMHTLGIRHTLVEQHPWLANSLYNAFLEAKNIALEEMRDIDALSFTLPWLNDEIDQTIELMGDDYWPYGVEPNRPTLEAMVRYAYRHGTTARQLAVDELFVSSTSERFKV
jgi:4,5-dihydroxyphthalate decarboxylase